MKSYRSLGETVGLSLFAFIIATPTWAPAQTGQPAPAPDPLAGVPVQVLDQQQVDLGDHTMTLNRIAPPHLPPPPPPPAPILQTPALFTAPHQEKCFKMVSLSVAPLNQLFTEVRADEPPKPELRARLNVDFRLFGGNPSLETDDAFYMYIVAFAFNPTDVEAKLYTDPPDLTASLPERASYIVTAGTAADYPDALGGLDALCAYFDAHRAQLIADYRKRSEDSDIERRQPPAPTPKPRDAVINYWPVKSSVYPTAP